MRGRGARADARVDRAALPGRRGGAAARGRGGGGARARLALRDRRARAGTQLRHLK